MPGGSATRTTRRARRHPGLGDDHRHDDRDRLGDPGDLPGPGDVVPEQHAQRLHVRLLRRGAAARRRPAARRTEDGSAIADFALVSVVLVPLFFGILQLALIWHVKTTLTSAASEGARYGAAYDRTVDDGGRRTSSVIDETFGTDFRDAVHARETTVSGQPGVEVDVSARGAGARASGDRRSRSRSPGTRSRRSCREMGVRRRSRWRGRFGAGRADLARAAADDPAGLRDHLDRHRAAVGVRRDRGGTCGGSGVHPRPGRRDGADRAPTTRPGWRWTTKASTSSRPTW